MPPSYIIQNREGVCRAAELYRSGPGGYVSCHRAISFRTGRVCVAPPSYIIQHRKGVCRVAELYYSAPGGGCCGCCVLA
eukprot:1308504-Pyramimonas_sp.AAC.1